MDLAELKPLLTVFGPVGSILILGIFGFRKGWWHTTQEIEAKDEVIAEWKSRCKRSEDQVDQLLPKMDNLTDAIFGAIREGSNAQQHTSRRS